MQDKISIDTLIAIAEEELAKIDTKRDRLLKQIETLKRKKEGVKSTKFNITSPTYQRAATNLPPENDNIALFRLLFRGREDVFPKRFESLTTGKRGYLPACRNEWIKGFCKKPKIKCKKCSYRDFLPVTDEVIKSHLSGVDNQNRSKRNFTIGVYPLLKDETCCFLAVDFDKETWMKDVSAFLDTCEYHDVPAVLERSRSGNGGHIWIFFSEPIQAYLARKLGSFLVTETMEHRPEIGFKSYDRFFPSQDTLPEGGFGNLIALPLQKVPSEKDNSLFVDRNFIPYSDQWAYLASIQRMSYREVEKIVDVAAKEGRIFGVKTVATDEDNIEPWLESPSRRKKETSVKGPLPKEVKLVLSNQIYIEKKPLNPALRNRLIRIAAFQNPAFYRAQAMRSSTYGKLPVIYCSEDFPKHIGLPRGCLGEVVSLLESLEIEIELIDERFAGWPINVRFRGQLRTEQRTVVEALLRHDTGVLSASTAFGKTVVAINLIAKRNVNTLVLVHRKHLLDQWIARLTNFLDIDAEEVGQIRGGKRDPKGMIDVALIQSLNKKGIVDDVVGEYGYLIVDECHHIPATSFEVVARRCKAKYVTGLSATVIRKEGDHPIIFMNCGPLRYKVDDRKQAEFRPFEHKVIVRETDFRLPDLLSGLVYPAMHEVYSALVCDDRRNNMIVGDVLKVVKENRFPILLTERRQHLEMFADILSPMLQNVFILHGGLSYKQKQSMSEKIKAVSANEEKVIIATGRYLGEGFDEARLDSLFLTLPISWKGLLNQYAGRLHRLHELKKEVIIYDYVDLGVPMLAKMFKKRIQGYKAIGYEIMYTDSGIE
jgi:superfamily II DNA or RNA helicase